MGVGSSSQEHLIDDTQLILGLLVDYLNPLNHGNPGGLGKNGHLTRVNPLVAVAVVGVAALIQVTRYIFIDDPEQYNPTVMTVKKKLSEPIRNCESSSWPTEEQVTQTLRDREYDTSLLHFAVCGAAGSGKSTLINSLRGIPPGTTESAETGVVETTAVITRYPDPRQDETPYNRFVWYDIPGAGTTNVPAEQYFVDQGLYVFDFIVLVWGDRWTAIDKMIVEDAMRFRVPLFIVRSKSDEHIENMMKKERHKGEVNVKEEDWEDVSEDGLGYDTDDDDNGRDDDLHRNCKQNFIAATRENFESNITVKLRSNTTGSTQASFVGEIPELYLVNTYVLGKLVSKPSRSRRQRKKDRAQIEREGINEEKLLEDMLMAALERRYGGVFAELKAKVEMLISDSHDGGNEKE